MNATKAVIDRLKAAGLNPKVKTLADGSFRLSLLGVSDAGGRRGDKRDVEIDVAADGVTVTRASKYAYYLPECVGDDVRLAD